MRFAKVIQQLEDNKRLESGVQAAGSATASAEAGSAAEGGGGGGGANDEASTRPIPYCKFSDFQRALGSCTDPTALLLVCASPMDVVPHCIAHTALLGLSVALLNDAVAANRGGGAAAASSSSDLSGSFAKDKTGAAGPRGRGGDAAAASETSSLLDVANIRAASTDSVLSAVALAAKAGTWLVVPEVSALSLATWTEVGKLLAAATPGYDDDARRSRQHAHTAGAVLASPPDVTLGGHRGVGATGAAPDGAAGSALFTSSAASAGATSPGELAAAHFGLHESSLSPHFRLVAFLTAASAPLGRVLSPGIAQHARVIDTRGVVRAGAHELAALFSSVTQMSARQHALLCVGIGDGRTDGGAIGGGGLTGIGGATVIDAVSSHSLPLRGGAHSQQQPQQQSHALSPSPVGGAAVLQPGFFVDWQCAAALADVPVTLHSSDPATTSDYVDAALYALRETLLRTLGEHIQTATRLDQLQVAARRRAVEARALRTGQDPAELQLVEDLRQLHAETNMTRLERTPGWIFQSVYEWAVGCAPAVAVERLPTIAIDELAVEDVLWVHEGVADATACLRGTWQLAPVCVKLSLPSMRPALTARLNNRLLVEGRTLFSVRHPAVLAVYGLVTLPPDLGSVQGGATALRPLLAAAAMHERWLDAQDDLRRRGVLGADTAGDESAGSPRHESTTAGAGASSSTSSAALEQERQRQAQQQEKLQQQKQQQQLAVRQLALVTEPFESSLEQLLLRSFDCNTPWTVGQMLDVAVSVLRALVHLSDTLVHRCVCPTNIVVCGGAPELAPRRESPQRRSLRLFSVTSMTLTTSGSAADYDTPAVTGQFSRGATDSSGGGGDDAPATFALPSRLVPAPSSSSTAAAAAAAPPSDGQRGPAAAAPGATRLVCKLANFAAAVPTSRRVAPPWLVATHPATMPLRYCAPETFWGHFTPASDVYSFGVMLWTMLHYCRREPLGAAPGSAAADVNGGASATTTAERKQRRRSSSSSLKADAARRLSDRPEEPDTLTTLRRRRGRSCDENVAASDGRSLLGRSGSESSAKDDGEDDDDNNNGGSLLLGDDGDSDDSHGSDGSGDSATGGAGRGTQPQDVAEGVAAGTLRLEPLSARFPGFLWTHLIAPCVQRRPSERPDARALISRIMALRMQHRAQLSDAVEFDDAL
jgi:hypothetical protein